MMNDKKSPVQKFLEGKGFYIALALCVAGTRHSGLAGGEPHHRRY